MRFTYIVDEKVSGRYGIIKKDYKVAVAGAGVRDIILFHTPHPGSDTQFHPVYGFLCKND